MLLVQVAITCGNVEKAPYWKEISAIQKGLDFYTEDNLQISTIDAAGLALQVCYQTATCYLHVG